MNLSFSHIVYLLLPQVGVHTSWDGKKVRLVKMTQERFRGEWSSAQNARQGWGAGKARPTDTCRSGMGA